MRLYSRAILAAVLLGFAPAAHSQNPDNWSASITCEQPADTARLQVTLPLEVLNHLDRMSSSVFVHAFLIRHIADPSAGRHRLSLCARQFVDAQMTDFRTLRQNVPDAAAIIDALRTAERARLRTLQLADSARTLPAEVARLRADTSQATLEGSSQPLASAVGFCKGDNTGACRTVRDTDEQLGALRRARSQLATNAGQARQAAEEAARAAEAAEAAATELSEAALLLNRLETAAVAADSTAIGELRPRIDRWREETRARVATRDSLRRSAAAADSARQQAASAAEDARRRLDSLLDQLAAELRRPDESDLARRPVEVLQISHSAASVAPVTVPPPQSGDANPRARSANILLELTDFIIVRMRREAVNSFIVNLHGFAKEEPLLRHGFPETWGLMRGLSARPGGAVNAVEVGRIPLNTWRATLAGDFVKLPVNLLEAGHVALCRQGEGASDAAGREAAVEPRNACRQRVAMLEPLAPVATRLLSGDPVFDVLREATSFNLPEGPDVPAEWRFLSQGVTVLATLAETFLVQGYSSSADPDRHPYMLTAESLTRVPQAQRDAFVRLLLVRAVPSAADVPGPINPAALHNASAAASRLLARIAARPTAADPRPADAAIVMRSALEAFVSAADLARVLAPEGAAAWLGPLTTRWRAVSGILESITARDFGLTLSRTTTLLHDVRGVPVPGPVLTFTALASSLSEAQDGGQVRAAFEAAASPVGGWQAKRYGEGGGSITAFPGLAAGYEYVIREADDPPDAGETAMSFGASLPIGLEWQMRLPGAGGTSAPDCAIGVCGVGVFLPLIDLGALLSYRVDGPDEVESEPNANFRQVFAPGLYLSLALTRTVPINLLIGGQLMPSLRSVSRPEGLVSRSAVRWGVGLGMDILLFEF